MLFRSFPFLVLLIITFLIYYLPIFAKYQVQILIVASLIFYSYHQPVLVLLLLFSAFLNVIVSYYIVFGKTKHKKTLCFIGVALNLLIIIFFKYSLLFANVFNITAAERFILSIPLPIGISFFTFEGISLLVDVYREKNLNKEIASRSLLTHTKKTLFFISFFPHLVAGPILKAHDFYPQISTKKLGQIKWEGAFKALITGYFLKMVCADNLKDYTFWLSFPFFKLKSSIDLVIMLFGYSFQIFADFAGYSLIAIGLAKLFGYEFQQNFCFPYIATSFREFWKRWHISLSTFLMEYLYFPLGGNRKGKLRTYLNLLITMILGGLWHGAAISYAVWGAFHGCALSIERFVTDKIKIKESRLTKMIKGLLVFLFITLAWLLFKLPDFNNVIDYFKSISDNFWFSDDVALQVNIIIYSIPVIVYHIAYLLKASSFYKQVIKFDFVFYSVMLFLMITNSGSAGSFIYFQF